MAPKAATHDQMDPIRNKLAQVLRDLLARELHLRHTDDEMCAACHMPADASFNPTDEAHRPDCPVLLAEQALALHDADKEDSDGQLHGT